MTAARVPARDEQMLDPTLNPAREGEQEAVRDPGRVSPSCHCLHEDCRVLRAAACAAGKNVFFGGAQALWRPQNGRKTGPQRARSGRQPQGGAG